MFWNYGYSSLVTSFLIAILIVLPSLTPINHSFFKIPSPSIESENFSFSEKEFDRHLQAYKTHLESKANASNQTSKLSLGPASVDALTTFNGYFVGSLVNQIQKLIIANQQKSGTSCKLCKTTLIMAKKMASVSKDLIPQVIQSLCDADQDAPYANSAICQQMPWNRQITVYSADTEISDSVGKFKRGLEKRRFRHFKKKFAKKINNLKKKPTYKSKPNNKDNDEKSYKNPYKYLKKPEFSHHRHKSWSKYFENDQDEEEEEEEEQAPKSNFANDIANILELMDPKGNDGQVFCYIFGLKSCGIPTFEEPNLDDWWPPKPRNARAPEPCGETFNVLHLSDIHLQRHYEPGSEANCVGLMCCQPNSVYLPTPQKGTIKESTPAPKMGHYNCDTPEVLFDSAMQDVLKVGRGLENDGYTYMLSANSHKNKTTLAHSSSHEAKSSHNHTNFNSLKNTTTFGLKPRSQDGVGFEFAIFTGDMVDHDSLTISYEDSVWEEEHTLRKFKEYLGGMPVYTVLGNHDTYPYGQVAQHKSGYSNLFNWNTELMIDLWKEFGWLGDSQNPNRGWSKSEQKAFDDAREHYGGFAVTTRQGLRVISLNSNFWYMWNLYNYWDTEDFDTSGSFKFLADELVACEENGQYAWIIAHVPPGGDDDDAIPKPSAVFSKIIQRFSPHIITGIFFGHTHRDEFQILYAGNVLDHALDKGNDVEAVNVAWISQSITPLVNYNPGWRYYKVDKKSFSIMDSVNFYTPLEETIEFDRDWTDWRYLYSARDTYDLGRNWPENKPLDGEFWSEVARTMKDDNDITRLYLMNGYRRSPNTLKCKDDSCRHKNYCYVTSFNSVQASRCHLNLGLEV